MRLTSRLTCLGAALAAIALSVPADAKITGNKITANKLVANKIAANKVFANRTSTKKIVGEKASGSGAFVDVTGIELTDGNRISR
jgi:hypothetical protein